MTLHKLAFIAQGNKIHVRFALNTQNRFDVGHPGRPSHFATCHARMRRHVTGNRTSIPSKRSGDVEVTVLSVVVVDAVSSRSSVKFCGDGLARGQKNLQIRDYRAQEHHSPLRWPVRDSTVALTEEEAEAIVDMVTV